MVFSCLCFSTPKESVDRTSQPLESRRQEVEAHKAIEAGKLGAQHTTLERVHLERQKTNWEQAQKYKTDKNMLEAEEKRTLNYYSGGLARGFDPNAGMIRSGRDRPSAVAGTGMSVNIAERAPDTFDLRRVRGHTWGIQSGDLGKHVGTGQYGWQGAGDKHKHSGGLAG